MSIQKGVTMKADDLILKVIKKSDSDQVRDHFHLELENKRDQIKYEVEKKFGKNLKSGIGIFLLLIDYYFQVQFIMSFSSYSD